MIPVIFFFECPISVKFTYVVVQTYMCLEKNFVTEISAGTKLLTFLKFLFEKKNTFFSFPLNFTVGKPKIVNLSPWYKVGAPIKGQYHIKGHFSNKI